ncbi:MAG: type II toxin-antitoxin system HicB family antitoxin [archaeon]
MEKQFDVLIERDEDGVYVASVPELPGCYTQADSLDELVKNVKEAIEAYLESMKKEERTKTEFVGIRKVRVAVR